MQRYISYTWGKLGEQTDKGWRDYNPNMSDSSLPPGPGTPKGMEGQHSGSSPTLWNPPRKIAPVRRYNAQGELVETLTVAEFRKKHGPVRKKGHDRKTA